MNIEERLPVDRAAQMRRAFDQSFAAAPAPDDAPREDLLAVRIGAMPYGIRLAEVAGVFADKNVTWVPTSTPALLGIAGFRGAILPVYDLRALLGYSSAAAPRWMVLVAQTPVGLAFDQFDGHVRVRREAIVPEARAEGRREYVQSVVHDGDLVRPIVDVASIVDAIKSRVQDGARRKER